MSRLLFIFLIFSVCLYGENSNLQKDMHLNAAYFETGEFDYAQKGYEELSQRALADWQKAIIVYNRALSLLDEEELESANRHLYSIELKNDPNPRFNFLLFYAKSLVSFEQAKELIERQGKEKEPLDYFEADWKLKEALSMVDKSKTAFCHLKNVEGFKNCPDEKNITDLKQKIEQLIQSIKKEVESFRSQNLMLLKSDDFKIDLKTVDPENFLELLIKNQKDAITLSAQLRWISTQDASVDSFTKAIQHKQSEIAKISKNFTDVVTSWQRKEFDNRSIELEKRKCFKKPWDKVVPLFEQGHHAASAADKIVMISPLNFETLFVKQNEALEAWKAALRLLREQEKAESKETPKPPSSGQPIKTTSIQDVMQLLEQMEQDDKLPQVMAPSQTDISRPW